MNDIYEKSFFELDKELTAYPKILKNSYIGAIVTGIDAALDEWKKLCKEHELFHMKHVERDGDQYHVTILTPKEFRQTGLTNVPNFKFKQIGIAKAQKDSNETWCLLLESEEAQKWRESNGLPRKEFHVTFGFRIKDIHDRPRILVKRFKNG